MQKLTLIIIVLSVVLSGCRTGRSVATMYYILEHPGQFRTNIDQDPAPVKKSCSIKTIEVNPAFSTNQIAIRENTHELRYFSFNQWATRPEQSLTTMLIGFMNNNNIFQTLYSPGPYQEPDYFIETTVNNLQVIDDGNSYSAHLNIEFRLKDHNTQQMVLNHMADRKTMLDKQNLNLFASAISQMFIDELTAFTNKILTDLE